MCYDAQLLADVWEEMLSELMILKMTNELLENAKEAVELWEMKKICKNDEWFIFLMTTMCEKKWEKEF